jgi:NAD(P)H-dependent FMN reductase
MILLVSGTNRPGSNTRRVTRLLEALYAEQGTPCEVLDLARLPLDVFLPGAYAEKPPAFAPFAEAVRRAAGVHLVTPEYNGGMPGVLKHFLDLLPFPESFARRPVALTGLAAGRWGALRPVEQLAAILGYRHAHLYPEHVFLPGIGELLDDARQLREAELHGRLRGQAAGFAAFVQKLRA